MDEVIASSLARRRFSMILLVGFATLALLLASVGIYGVISYVVGQRTHEIGIRMALGARQLDILRLVLSGAGRLAVIGIGVGLVSALALTRLMATLLYGVGPNDPLTFIAVPAILVSVALLASYLPARRASKVDPMVALRYE
jgi:ABC-type antimicrobial peptide transport system permease subunit